jgi:tRNA threonylcarbamoyladenosine biosynthesis protein TsaE
MIFADETALRTLGVALADIVRVSDVIALRGDLGAGKTTLARGILGGLGLQGEAPSPTFAIVQPYDPPAVRIPVIHSDLYRVDSPDEIDELGLDDARADSLLLIEWPERMGGRLWPDALILSLAVAPEGGRRLTATVPKSWEGRWPPR